MGKYRKISRYQLLCLGFLAILSPIIRLLPRQLTLVAGDSAWVCAIFAAVPAGALLLLTGWFFRRLPPGEGMAELLEKALGKPLGKILTLLIALWLIAYTAFSLRSAADRYVITAYRQALPLFFAVALLVLAAIPAFGHIRSLARTAQVLFPLMALALVLVFLFAAGDADFSYNAPVLSADYASALAGVPSIANILALAVYFGFMEGSAQRSTGSGATLLWLGLMTLIITLLCLFAVGLFGARVVSSLDYTFFAIVRSINVLDILERLESLVLGLWVISDFILLSSLIFIVYTALRRSLNYGDSGKNQRLADLKNGRWLLWLALAAILAGTLLLPDDAELFAVLSQRAVPFINLIFTYGLLPLALLVGRLRKSI